MGVFLGRLLRVLFLLFLVRLALRAVAQWLRPSRPAAGPGPAARPLAELVRDRVCNTFVPRDRALHAMVAGREEHFCSAACRDRALATVERAS
jgi:hypothetical protein